MNYKNKLCPCGSGVKYKKCCMVYHKGSNPKDALTLMKSRYSAYAVGDANYIIKTTHKNSIHFEENRVEWIKSIKEFSKSDFKKLEIINFYENKNRAYVEFNAYIDDYIMHEKSIFINENGKWFYLQKEE